MDSARCGGRRVVMAQCQSVIAFDAASDKLDDIYCSIYRYITQAEEAGGPHN